NTALLASTYQSQYSFQKKRYNAAVASLNLYSFSAIVTSRIAASSFSKIHLSSGVSNVRSISPCTSPPCIWRKRHAFHSLLQKLRPSSTSFSSNNTSCPNGAPRIVPKRNASAPRSEER